jgi:hypothetical protein
MPTIRAQGGQATVELVALLPLLAVLGVGLWQAAVAGQAIWLAGAAARAAARAEALGTDPAPAARDVLPPRLEEGLSVRPRDGGGVTVTLRIPSVVGSGALASTSAEARFVPQTP